jgi:hypothetical protein
VVVHGLVVVVDGLADVVDGLADVVDGQPGDPRTLGRTGAPAIATTTLHRSVHRLLDGASITTSRPSIMRAVDRS